MRAMHNRIENALYITMYKSNVTPHFQSTYFPEI